MPESERHNYHLENAKLHLPAKLPKESVSVEKSKQVYGFEVKPGDEITVKILDEKVAAKHRGKEITVKVDALLPNSYLVKTNLKEFGGKKFSILNVHEVISPSGFFKELEDLPDNSYQA